jgi:general secretion pathway protein G
MKKQKGFTLIELLVVIAIIGLLSTLAVVALNNARQKSRDAKRISDVKQIQTALELYYNDENGYPASVSSGGAITGATSGVTYMNIVPTNPTPVDGCTVGASYTYTQQSSGGSYSLTYCLGGATGGLTSGAHVATPAGIDD